MPIFEKTQKGSQVIELPFIIVDEIVCFPGSSYPLFLSAKSALAAIDVAMDSDRNIFVSHRTSKEGGSENDLSIIGTICRINQLVKIPGSGTRVLLDCLDRAQLLSVLDIGTKPSVKLMTLEVDHQVDPQTARLMNMVREDFKRYIPSTKQLSRDILVAINNADSPHKLADLICVHCGIDHLRKLDLLLQLDAHTRLKDLAVEIQSENQLLELKNDVSNRVKVRMEQTQKDYFVNEQIKELNKELSKPDDSNGIDDLKLKLSQADLPLEVETKVELELKRLGRMQAMSPESGICRTWLECVLDLPWHRSSPTTIDLQEAQEILNQDHYDLEDAKDRILDFLAIHRLQENAKAPIICFVGPPGTGKTSLAISFARALGREFVRVSLGGLRDESEIRGHRRTYVGALAGKIIHNIRKCGVNNPVFLLDEIDKLASDNRGDPASALLEVLDPEQNKSFLDHYLELPFDLSRVVFVATANNASNIPHPLRDRMELVEVSGYSRYDKFHIASDYIIPKLLKEYSIESLPLTFEKDALYCIIDDYTMEAGVRSLERCISRVLRKVARFKIPAAQLPMLKQDQLDQDRSEHSFEHITIDRDLVRSYLKRPQLAKDLLQDQARPGVILGLAWTEMGGTVMPVEVAVIQGKGEIHLTGKLGEVMKESARIALSVIKGLGKLENSQEIVLTDKDLHIHVPEGATPKDGPSAGITLACALHSALTARVVRRGLAMTGELTLSGRVLAVGGIREKLMAAHRHGLKEVLLPEANRSQVDDLPELIRAELSINFVNDFSQVLQLLY